jgi:choline dehydrogenase-like flavoprotein
MAEPTLTEREHAILAAVCDTFHPGSPPVVASAAEELILSLAGREQREMRLLLRLLDNPLIGLLSTGSLRGMTSRTGAERELLMRGLSTSVVPQLRGGFRALKKLTSFLRYSVTDERGWNSIWNEIGYTPSPAPPARSAPLRVTSFETDTTIDCDVCVVGSGAGGGVVAAHFASKGMKVVVLEAGPGQQAADFTQREYDGLRSLFMDSGLTATRDVGLSILAGACLGGGTAVNWQTCLRTPGFIRDEWSERSGIDLFVGDRFSAALDSVWRHISVSTDESEVNANNAPIRDGCSALDYEWAPIARNSRGCDLSQCGYCTFGCRVGGKQSTTITYLADAQRDGDTTIIAQCRAERVTMERGRATGVAAVHRTRTGKRISVNIRAPRVFVCAGGIQSPALLQRSNIALPQLGRDLYLHPVTAVAGIYEDRVEAWKGPPQTIVANQFARFAGNYGFRLEAAPVHPGLLASALPWKSAASHRDLLRHAAKTSAMIVLARDRTSGRVRARHDGGVDISYKVGPDERAMLERGAAEAERVHRAAGAREVVPISSTELFSAHQMGTCRMGRDERSAVCDERGAVFGVRGLYVADASAFPASSGVNPMITILALASCVAQSSE